MRLLKSFFKATLDYPAQRFEAELVKKLLALWQTETEGFTISEGGIVPSEYWPEFIERQANVLLPWLQKIMQAGLQDGVQAVTGAKKSKPVIEVNWELVNQQAADWAGQYGYDLIKQITETTQTQVQAAINQWINAGEAFPELTERINRIFNNPARARLIAATEATRAYAEANTIAWQDMGVQQREWRTAVDDLVCPICHPLHQSRAAMGAMFNGTIANPPAHPGCRCSLVPVVEVVESEVNKDTVQLFQEKYGVNIDLSPGYSITTVETKATEEILGKLPLGAVLQNNRFTELALSDLPYQLEPETYGVHYQQRITIFPLGRNLSVNTGEFFSKLSAFEETLLHEVGESVYKGLTNIQQAEWTTLTKQIVLPESWRGQPPSELFSITFSGMWSEGTDIPVELEKWVRGQSD